MASSYLNQQHSSNPPPLAIQPQRSMSGQLNIQGHAIQQSQQTFRTHDQLKKQSPSKPIKSSALAQTPENAQESLGDELDSISARDIAIARYKRNHDYLSEIFTPCDVDSITTAPLELSYNIEQVDTMIAEYKARSSQQKNGHNERMLKLEQERRKYWELMEKLNEADSLELIEEVSQRLSSELHVRINHTKENVKSSSIPDIEDEELMNTEQ